jgi:hypothetical protein
MTTGRVEATAATELNLAHCAGLMVRLHGIDIEPIEHLGKKLAGVGLAAHDSRDIVACRTDIGQAPIELAIRKVIYLLLIHRTAPLGAASLYTRLDGPA